AVRSIESDYYICAATGRPWPFAQPVFQGMSLVDPCIISGGTQICDPKTGKILWQCNIEIPDVRTVKEVLVKYPGYGLVINDFSERYYLGGGFPPDHLDTNKEIFFPDYFFAPDDLATTIAEERKAIKEKNCIWGTSKKPGNKEMQKTNRTATKEHAVVEL